MKKVIIKTTSNYNMTAYFNADKQT